MRKKIIAGNWKMNKTPSEAVALIDELKPLVANDEVDVVFCVPAIDIVPAVEATKDTNINIGAENLYFEESGAYTGEIAPNMLTDAGVKYVIIGHSERREYFAETDETCNLKLKALIAAGCEILKVAATDTGSGKDSANVHETLVRLGEMKISSILVEGGGTLAYSVLKSGAVNKVNAFIAPKFLGGAGAKTLSVRGLYSPLAMR